MNDKKSIDELWSRITWNRHFTGMCNGFTIGVLFTVLVFWLKGSLK